jgi:CheY-like chemotaxis protein
VHENVLLPDRGIGLILVIDDNLGVRDSIQHHLHRRGYGTLSASDAAETMQRARQHRPDAILLNMMMNGVGGVDVLRALKDDRATASLPLVLTSIVSDPARGILSVGAFSLVRHPFRDDRLCDAILALIGARDSAGPPRKALLIPAADSPAAQVAGLRAKLAAVSVGLQVASSLPDALAATITESPDLIVIDSSMPHGPLAELIGALKVEEEAARIPIVLTSEDIADTHVHRHAGNRASDSTGALEYLYEQLTRATSVSE